MYSIFLTNSTSFLQELQESVAEISTSNTAAKQDRDKYRDDVGDCPDSEQLAAEISAELKRQGVTVNHKIKKENIMAETNTDKDTETEVDRKGSSGAEEGFGEETAEETERNTENSEVESTLLEIIKPPENISEVDEISMENVQLGTSSTNTNLTLNSSSFQGQHRFDLQTNKNSTMDKVERVKPAQVTIQIIPHNISLQLGNNDHDQLLGLDLHNFAAIIQNSDSTVNQRSQAALAFVHKTPSNDNNTHVTQINTYDRDAEVDGNLEPDVNATLHEEIKYINGTFTYNQSKNSGVSHSTEIHSGGILVARNNEEIMRNKSPKVSEPPHIPAITILVTNKEKTENLSITEIKKNGSSDGFPQLSDNNLLTSHSSHNSSHSDQTFNISDKEHVKTDGTISTTNLTHAALENVTESNSNNTGAVSEVQATGPLKRIMDLNTHEGKGNLTIQDFWRDLQLAKKQLDKNGKNDTLMVNNLITFTQNSSENEDPEWVKHTPSTLFSTDAIQNLVSAMNDTEDRNYDIQRQQYLSRLQELATELVSRTNGSSVEISDYFNLTNTTDEIRDVTSDEGNNK
jgi:hypothetical protein